MSTALQHRTQEPAPPRVMEYYRFTVAQYHQMIQRGILKEDDPVELLEGYVVRKMPRNPPHDSSITRIQRRIAPLISDDWLIRIQSAITVKDSEPEPDIVVVSGPEEEYDTRHPTGSDIALLIEVSDSSLEEDRGVKSLIYARARIPIYWIVNIPAQQIEVYTQPRAGKSPAYKQRNDYGIDATVPLVLGNKVIAHLPVRPLLPEPPSDEQVESR